MKKYGDLLNPSFIIGYTTLIALIMALFMFVKYENIVMAIITVLTNILTGATTFYFTISRPDKEDQGNE